MKKLILIFLAILVNLDMGIYAQAQAPSIVLESNGKIKGTDAKGKQVVINAGTAMMPNTTFELCKKSSLVMLENDKFKFINEKGEYTTKSKAQDANSASILNFDPTFAEFIKASLAIVNQNISLGNLTVKNNNKLGDGWGVSGSTNGSGWGASGPTTESGWGVSGSTNGSGWGVSGSTNGSGWGVSGSTNGSGWGVSGSTNGSGWGVSNPTTGSGWGVSGSTNGSGWGVSGSTNGSGWGADDPRLNVGWGVSGSTNGSGWGEEDMTIFILTPGGLYEPKKVNLSWILQDDVEEYLIVIMDQNLNLIKRESTTNNILSFDLSDLNPDVSYYWQVLAKEKKAVSIPIAFDVASKQDIKEINDLPKDSDIYSKVNKATQGMMLAVAYEDQGMYALAMKTYKELLKSNPKNNLLRINYIAFSLRMGMTSKALELAKF